MKLSHSYASSLFLALITFGLIAFGASSARAVALTGSGASFEERLSRLEQQAANQPPAPGPINAGDNAWVLVSSALVLMMTAPGLILFYGGLVRSKNVLSTMMHSLILMAFVSMLWMIFGYSLAFAPGNAFFGNPLTHFMLNGVGGAPNPDYSSTVPQASFMLFQMMFAIITPALISGAVAERIKFKAYVVFVLLWTTLVYFPSIKSHTRTVSKGDSCAVIINVFPSGDNVEWPSRGGPISVLISRISLPLDASQRRILPDPSDTIVLPSGVKKREFNWPP